MTEHVGVAIVGAGIAGLGLLLRLAEAGRRDAVVLERGDGVGGTWRDNTYPGVACDIPAHLYSFSFAPRAGWSRRYAPGAEIRAYLERCARPVQDRIRLRTAVVGAAWEADAGVWRITTDRGVLTADALVLAVGRLVEPAMPDLPGLEAFPGPVRHTARWEPGLDVAGEAVGIVGTGASAVQLAPRLVEAGARVTVFQRTAPWIVPREDVAYDEATRTRFAADDAARAAHRAALFAEQEAGFDARRLGTPALDAARARARAHLEEQVPDPALRAVLTPDTEMGCKRILLSDEYYPAVAAGGIRVVPSALAALDGGTAVAASGERVDLDALVLATGFVTDRPPIASTITGTDGALAAAWAEGMRAFASVAVPGFPNLFVLDGPNAALGHNSAVHMIETQIAYVLGALDHVAGGAVLDVDPAAEQAYADEVQARAADTVWLTCDSWYRHGASGRLALLWPGTATAFRERNGRFDPEPYRVLARR
ncbi:NAD(P)/FAD-dependent oxidoreductase [Amnibacterium soli]|uniref:NAD(P)/FAD-dependent oxidoreductase n=1 Tax=Amnibacterium soli TaxID=1282736 RepID=A0ABP8YR18_9MICO